MNIRQMTASDLDQVTALEESCFSQPWRRADFEDILTREDRIYLVAEQDGKIIGGCMMSDIAGEGDISNVAVHQQFRRQHVAGRLLESMFAEGRKRGLQAYTLEVREQNRAAIGLYEKAGFHSEGVRPGFYDLPKDNAVIMWKYE